MSWFNPELEGTQDSNGDATGNVVTMGGIVPVTMVTPVAAHEADKVWGDRPQPIDRTYAIETVGGVVKGASIIRAVWEDPTRQGGTGGGGGGSSRPTSGIVFP